LSGWFMTEKMLCVEEVGGDKALIGDLARCEEQNLSNDVEGLKCFRESSPFASEFLACMEKKDVWKMRAHYLGCYGGGDCKKPLQAYDSCATSCAREAEANNPLGQIRAHCAQVNRLNSDADAQPRCVRYLAPQYARAFDECVEVQGCATIRRDNPECFSNTLFVITR
jgi:hypothetical protein